MLKVICGPQLQLAGSSVPLSSATVDKSFIDTSYFGDMKMGWYAIPP